eukprot:TRINITY_DN669_c0_g1_i2.p1 TRINITY_DN669_c0_g1~~TRINITY_DN669_c0_g1_i2.p1  ORF type:complete len:497 (+),score=106.03 TRINITY_DN669_c0_g1_i2:67-1491(+)
MEAMRQSLVAMEHRLGDHSAANEKRFEHVSAKMKLVSPVVYKENLSLNIIGNQIEANLRAAVPDLLGYIRSLTQERDLANALVEKLKAKLNEISLRQAHLNEGTEQEMATLLARNMILSNQLAEARAELEHGADAAADVATSGTTRISDEALRKFQEFNAKLHERTVQVQREHEIVRAALAEREQQLALSQQQLAVAQQQLELAKQQLAAQFDSGYDEALRSEHDSEQQPLEMDDHLSVESGDTDSSPEPSPRSAPDASTLSSPRRVSASQGTTTQPPRQQEHSPQPQRSQVPVLSDLERSNILDSVVTVADRQLMSPRVAALQRGSSQLQRRDSFGLSTLTPKQAEFVRMMEERIRILLDAEKRVCELMDANAEANRLVQQENQRSHDLTNRLHAHDSEFKELKAEVAHLKQKLEQERDAHRNLQTEKQRTLDTQAFVQAEMLRQEVLELRERAKQDREALEELRQLHASDSD